MKILHLASQFFPEYSGSSTRLYHLLSHLPQEISLVVNNRTLDGRFIALREEKFGNIDVWRIPLEPSGICNKLPLRYFYHLAIKEHIKKMVSRQAGIAVMHAHGTQVVTGESGMEIARKRKIPFVCEIHADRREYTSGWWKHIHTAYVDHKTRQILNFSDYVIALTFSLKKWISRHYGISDKKIEVVPNGVDTKMFSQSAEYAEQARKIREDLGIDGRKVVMYSGYMDTINGVNMLARSIPTIIAEKKNIVFLFIGHGPESEKIKVLAKD